MLRSSIYTASVLLLGASAFAQGNLKSQARPITTQVKNAGVYHLGTGTWTRGVTGAAFQGTEVIFDNTCASGYFSGQQQGQRWVTTGRLPAANGPLTASSAVAGGYDEAPGCPNAANKYDIQGFTIAWCAGTPAGGTGATINIGFQQLYATCTASAPTNNFAITGMPSTPTLGVYNCWQVTLDLTTNSSNFLMLADGTGSYVPPSTADTFGWSFSYASPTTFLGANFGYDTGPIMAGHPAVNHAPVVCTGTDGTRWDGGTAPAPIWPANNIPFSTAELGTGMGTLDQFRQETVGAAGCYWFNSPLSGIFASFHMEIYSTVTCAAAAPLTLGCDGTIANGCPCGNPGSGPGRGCDNSAASGGSDLSSSGVMSVGTDTLSITAAHMRTQGTCILLQGVGGAPLVFGQGIRCVNTGLKRLFVKAYTNSSITLPGAGDPTISASSAAHSDPLGNGSTRSYLVYYRDPNVLAGCPTGFAAFTWNASTTGTGTWGP